MKHCTIIIPEGKNDLTTIACIAGAYEILAYANAYWKENGRKELFKIQLAGISKKVDFYSGMLTLKPHVNISSVTKTHLIIVPSFNIHYAKVEQKNEALTEWVEKHHNKGAEVASLCTGAFMLASAGLLDGKVCSTHWGAEHVLRAKFPLVNFQTEKLITDEKGIYTNGGGYSFLNLMIYLVEKYFDRETAIYIAKLFQVEIDRKSQSAFTIFTGQKVHGDEMVKEAQNFIESNLKQKISVEYLVSKFAIGRRNFDRRFIKATGNTPLEYWQRVKIESAKKSFETSSKSIHEVMQSVGYGDVKAFREVFRKITGLSPLEYRRKYNKYNKKAVV